MQIVPFDKRPQRSPSPLLPHENSKTSPVYNHKEGSNQALTMQAPCSRRPASRTAGNTFLLSINHLVYGTLLQRPKLRHKPITLSRYNSCWSKWLKVNWDKRQTQSLKHLRPPSAFYPQNTPTQRICIPSPESTSRNHKIHDFKKSRIGSQQSFSNLQHQGHSTNSLTIFNQIFFLFDSWFPCF